ncbi:type VI secretion system tube protein Hcp [Roseisolibacter sp. H3M3-2]|uniref:Hcp family type VI secretion system effector n=1 Tax=Roseisolibacter sp. H3M3-2 TaxID=3031323 RepID=UPI0023DC49E3|nr:type VI secretion system tube protein Hcp [Roseisolibacter sp. H3M3-2]MDF1504990.1 type VI secretion system tube protein Hcp [Roseisolibacter sp. H3M3-2]
MPIYMKIEPEIKGEVTAEGFKDQIALHSFQFGAGIAVSSAQGNAGKRSATDASFSEITVTSSLDNATGPMLDQLAAGKAADKITISFTKASSKNAAGNDKYLIITIENVFISGVSMSSGGDEPSVSISLNYAKIKAEYHMSDVSGNLTKGLGFGWDLTTQKSYA